MKITIKRAVSMLLSILMVLSIFSMNLFATTTSALEYATGDILTFGTYPQTKVTDSSLITSLNAQILQADQTVTYDGSKYKRVYFSQYTSYFGGTTTSTDDTYQDDNGYNINTVYWFKFKPIQWRVLSNTNGELFVMAEKILDSKQYNQVNADVTWETCTLRTWLNNDFYNAAFSSTEQAQINTSAVVNDNNPDYGTPGGNDTNDKLFVLSYAEAINPSHGFKSNLEDCDPARETQGTDFSKSNGLYVETGNNYSGNSDWWLRSPGYNEDDVGFVYYDGYVDCYGYVDYDNYIDTDPYLGVRPAFKINLSPFTPPFVTSKTTNTVTLAWNEAADATGYTVYNGFTKVNATPIPEAAYTVTGLTADTEYSFTIKAVNAGGEYFTFNPLSVTTENYVTGDIITFGSYPQTQVTDSSLITSLNAQTLQAGQTVTYDGSKYKRVYFSEYTSYIGGTTTSTDDTYQDDNGYNINMVYWFKFEPIQWRVLSNTNGELFVMAEKILESREYNQVYTGVTWETCTLRTWLNNDFYNAAFSSTEQTQINTSAVVNDNNPDYGTPGGNDTNDKLFLLSYAEAINPSHGFNSNIETSDPARQTQGTDFSKSNGLYVYTDSSNLGDSFWWLRSPGRSPGRAGSVGYGGSVGNYVHDVDYTYIGARPAFKINHSTITSLFVTSKTTNTVTLAWNEAVGATGYSIYKGSTKVNATPITEAAYTVTGLTADTEYSFTIKAVNAGGEYFIFNPLSVTTESYVTGDIITFGSYPQTRVTDSSLITSLNAQTLQADQTVTYDCSKYKKVFFTTVTNYQANNGFNINTVYWFKFEPLQWRVLSNTNGELFVMAEKILDSKRYNQAYANVTWETCTLRSWLNNDFYNAAFSATEQAQINTSAVVNDNNPNFGTAGGNNTNDKLFLLSFAEARNPSYGFSSTASVDPARQTEGTNFSKSNGLFVETGNPYSGNSSWWLRSPGSAPDNAGIINNDGMIFSYYYYVYDRCFGVRPAFKTNQSFLISTSTITFDADGGTAVAPITADVGSAVTAPADPTRTGYVFAGWSPNLPAIFLIYNFTATAQWTKTEVTLTRNPDDLEKFTVNIKGWLPNYSYQIWSYQRITSDLELNGSTDVKANQWMLSLPYTLGSEATSSDSGLSIDFYIGAFTSPNNNYTIAVRIIDENGDYIGEIRESFTPEDVNDAVITKVLVDGEYVRGSSQEDNDNNIKSTVIKEIKTGAAPVIKVIGNSAVTAYTATVVETGEELVAINGNEFAWAIENLEPRGYTVRVTASNATGTSTRNIRFMLYTSDVSIQYGVINSMSITGGTGHTLPQTIYINPDFGNGYFYYKINEPGRSAAYTSEEIYTAGNNEQKIDKYGVYRVYGFANRLSIAPSAGYHDDGNAQQIEIKRAVGPSTTTLTANVNLNPVNKGTQILFESTATIAGIEAATPVQYSFLRYDADGYILVKDWSADNTLSWTPGRVGNYTIEVRAKGEDAGSYEAIKRIEVNVVSTEQIAQDVVITVNTIELESAKAWTPIMVKASATSSNGNDLLYKFNVQEPMFDAQTRQGYSTNQEFVWIPKKAGVYNIWVLVKNQNSFGKYDAIEKIMVTVQ